MVSPARSRPCSGQPDHRGVVAVDVGLDEVEGRLPMSSFMRPENVRVGRMQRCDGGRAVMRAGFDRRLAAGPGAQLCACWR